MQVSTSRSAANSRTTTACPRISYGPSLPSQPQRELELAWVISRRGNTCLVPKGIHVSHVVTIGDIKQVHDPLQLEAVTQFEHACDAQIVEHRVRLGAGVAGQIPDEYRHLPGHERIGKTGRDQIPGWRILRWRSNVATGIGLSGMCRHGAISSRREVKVLVKASHDIERLTGGNLDYGSHRPVAPQRSLQSMTLVAALVHSTEDEAMPQIKQRVRAVEIGMVVVLWLEGGLKIGGVVNGVRPCIRSEKLPAVRELLLEVSCQSVVARGPTRVVRDHVTERNHLIAVAEVIVRQHLLRKSNQLRGRVVL